MLNASNQIDSLTQENNILMCDLDAIKNEYEQKEHELIYQFETLQEKFDVITGNVFLLKF